MGTCSGNGGTGGWLCQHRWPEMSGMVGFRNNVGSASLTNWISPASSQVAFSRESAGFVAINAGDSDWTATFATPMPSGIYCNVINGAKSGNSCTGSSCAQFPHSETRLHNDASFNRLTVNAGYVTTTVPARNAMAIHTGASITSVTANFAATVTTVVGQYVYVTGNLPQLGQWSPAAGVSEKAPKLYHAHYSLICLDCPQCELVSCVEGICDTPTWQYIPVQICGTLFVSLLCRSINHADDHFVLQKREIDGSVRPSLEG
jgi:hypothetical protein